MSGHLKRPSLDRRRPERGPGRAFRTADNQKTGLGGVTLASAEDAMVAAVRMAYEVADNQIGRSKRLADRLKGAADRATGNDPDDGQKSASDAVDAAGRLVNNALLSGMTWFEALMAADDGLAPRLAAAQLRAAKSVLFGAQRDANGGGAERTETPAGPPPRVEPETPRVRILLKAPMDDRRAVTITRWAVEAPISTALSFRLVGTTTSDATLGGRLEPPGVNDARPTLIMESTPAKAPPGRWRAAVCDDDDEQYGIIEIEI
jgi:hypothetical protein